jgi:L-rhamnose mutarotase
MSGYQSKHGNGDRRDKNKIDPLQARTMRLGSLIKLRPEYEERYIILHKHTFPGVLERIRQSNIRNYSIYLRNGILFSYYEYRGENFDRDMARIGEDPVTQDWWKLTDPMQEPMDSRKKGEWWAAMDEIFHWEGMYESPENARRLACTAHLLKGVEERVIESFKVAYPILAEAADWKVVRNFSVFHKDGCFCWYLEFFDKNSTTNIKKLQENLKVEDELDWEPMKEVFHTD